MSLGRAAMPSSRMRAPSLIIGKISRSTISSPRWPPRRSRAATTSQGSAARPRDRGTACAIPARSDRIPCRFSGRNARFAQRIGDRRALPRRLANAPADIEPREIRHRERPHRKAETVIAASTSCGSAPSSNSRSASTEPARQHAVANKAVADADDDRHLAELAAERDRGGERVGRRFFAAHDFQQYV